MTGARPTGGSGAAWVLECARAQGFALAGVCDASPSRREPDLVAWLEAGKHGTMEWLARDPAQRSRPARVLDGAKSVIVVADLYHTRAPGSDAAGESRQGCIARYARGRDYHRVMKSRLHALCDTLAGEFAEDSFRAFVDTAPVNERDLAARAGLGWIGKHTLLIHPRLGSYMLLGGVLTTLDLNAAARAAEMPDHCGTCTRCIDACPTDAITPYSVDARRCISYLTIERREPIPEDLRSGVGGWVFGCDICQEVCPHNSPRAQGVGRAHEAYEPRREGFDLLEVLGWDEDDRRAAFQTSAMKRATLDMMRRNAAIAAGNIGRDVDGGELVSVLRTIAGDPDEPSMVRDAARWACGRLDGSRDGQASGEPPLRLG